MAGDLDEAYVQKLARYVDEKMSAGGRSDADGGLGARGCPGSHGYCRRTSHAAAGKGDRDENLRERAEQCLTILERALKQTA